MLEKKNNKSAQIKGNKSIRYFSLKLFIPHVSGPCGHGTRDKLIKDLHSHRSQDPEVEADMKTKTQMVLNVNMLAFQVNLGEEQENPQAFLSLLSLTNIIAVRGLLKLLSVNLEITFYYFN